MNLAIIKSGAIIILLLIGAIYDLKKRTIPLLLILSFGAVILLLSLIQPRPDIVTSCLGAILGIVLLVLSKAFDGAVGEADGLVMLIVGFGMGIYGGCVVLFYGLFLAALVSIVLLCFKKLSKKDSIPFVPFLLVSYLGVYLG